MRFERPGAQASDAAAVNSTGAASLEKLSETEKVTMQIAHDSDRVARKELMEQTGVGKMKAAETLKRLAEKGLLEWVGSNQHDPRQYYRAVAGHTGLYQQPLALVVVVGCHLVRQRGARAYNAHPFCQDGNARQDGDFAQAARIAGNLDGAFRAAWDALENRNST